MGGIRDMPKIEHIPGSPANKGQKPFKQEYIPQGRLIKVKGGEYIVKLVRKRWYHKVFRLNKSKCQQIGVATLKMSLFIDNRGRLRSESENIPIQKGEVIL